MNSDRRRAAPAAGPAVRWAVVALLAILAFGAYLRFVDSGPLPPDEWWHGMIAVERGSAFYAVAVLLAQIGGSVGATACAAIASALLLALHRPRDAASLAFAMLCGVAGSQLLKSLVLRPRPWDQLYHSNGSSYPSGHSMGAAALAVSLALAIASLDAVSRSAARWVRLGAAGWILLMIWSRTALHVHWLSDTIAGALLGVAAALIARRLWEAPRAARAPARGASRRAR